MIFLRHCLICLIASGLRKFFQGVLVDKVLLHPQTQTQAAKVWPGELYNLSVFHPLTWHTMSSAGPNELTIMLPHVHLDLMSTTQTLATEEAQSWLQG